MRTLKLVIWDLDETILTGVFEEGDEDVNPVAGEIMQQLDKRGILQALATQNRPELITDIIQKFDWLNLFVQIEADLGPKARKVQRIIDTLGINPLDIAFIDDDPFERDSIIAQIPGITSWSIAELEAYLANNTSVVTEEAQRRPQMYREQQLRVQQETVSDNYLDFLHACNIRITIRPYLPEDAMRAEELLTRTHQMNLGVLPVDEAVARLNEPGEQHLIVAEMQDVYGDMGRCGIIYFRPDQNGEAVIESLAISCRTRARGLSLAMFIGLLRHPTARFQRYWCRYVDNGMNKPLRMLLMAAGFRPQHGVDQLILEAEDISKVELPTWVHLEYQEL